MPTDPRSTQRWRLETAAWLAQHQPTHCALCLRPLVPDAAPRTPDQTEVDHRVSIAEGCDPWDQSNWQAAHKRCNASKGARADVPRPPLVTSQDWWT
jgi:5-methylcytosine-specific restriction endonuclease McrA